MHGHGVPSASMTGRCLSFFPSALLVGVAADPPGVDVGAVGRRYRIRSGVP